MRQTFAILVDLGHLIGDRSHSSITTHTMGLLGLAHDKDNQSFPPTVPSCFVVLVSSQPSCNPFR